jgi:hypothetical protein
MGFLRNERGGVALIFALLSPVLIGAAAIAVEVRYDTYDQLKLQQAANSAAVAGAWEARRGSDSGAVRTAATSGAVSNGFTSATDVIALDTSGVSSVKTTITRTEPRFFSQIYTSAPLMVKVSATATFSTAGNACVLALNGTAAKAASFAGNTGTYFNGCTVMSDSNASNAINIQGSATLSAPCLYAVGGVYQGGALTSTTCTTPKTGQAPVGDPYQTYKPTTAMPASCSNGNGANLSPGRYCGGLTWKNKVSLQPGIYWIDGGSLTANANAVVTGSGVTFVFINNASVSFNGNATLTLSAPTSGHDAGMLFMGDASDVSNETFNGTAQSSMTGATHFPKAAVSYLGNFSGSNGCTQVVADTVQWSGNTTVNVDCSAYGLAPIALSAVLLTG